MSRRFFAELRRRGVLGALTAYGVVAAGGLQLGDIVVHAMDLPGWSMRLLVWLAIAGLPVTAVVSWFWDLTRHGFVRTQMPLDRPSPASTPREPTAATPVAGQRAVPAALPALGPGATLAGGRYRLERELGSGGMGRVFAAVDTRLGRRVAIKVVTASHDPARIRRFEQEARTAGALEHPNVLAVYDLGEEGGVPFLVTELLEGHTLRALLASGPMAADRAREVALQLARGLAAAHARGVVHRDLKPENLFLTGDGRLKILDFGLAKLVSPSEVAQGLTLTGAIFGTPGYLSPEQARGEGAGPSSDVFSAGAVIYELLGGQRAFPGRSLVEAGHAALTREPPALPPGVPAPLAAVVMRSLEKEPERRFQDGAEMAKALEAAQAGVALAEPARVPRYTRSTGLGLVAAGLAVGAAIASAVLVRRREPRGVVLPAGTRFVPRVPALPQHPVQDEEEQPDEDGQDEKDEPDQANEPPQPPRPVEPVPGIPGFDPEALKRQIEAQFAMSAGDLGVVAGARALARTGRADKAERLLRRQIEHRPLDPSLRLHLFALQRRLGHGEEAKRELSAYAARMRKDDPLWPAVAASAGKMSDAEAIAAAQAGGAQPAATYFYLGLLHATASPPDPELARRDFGAAISQDPHGPLRGFAQDELELLEAGGSSSRR